MTCKHGWDWRQHDSCPMCADENSAALLQAAKEREAHDYTKGKLAGALAALRQLQECVPPKDWKRYASDVLALDARDRERSNAKVSGPEAALSPEGRARLPGYATGDANGKDV